MKAMIETLQQLKFYDENDQENGLKSQEESDGREQRNNQKTKTMTTNRMKRRSHLPKAMAKNTTISKRPR